MHSVQSCPISGQDSGWLAPGQSISSWNCWSGGPVFVNGVEVFNLREIWFSGQFSTATGCGGSWGERVIALRQLKTGCPPGYTLRTGAGGRQECFMLPPADACPVAPLAPYSPDPYPLDTDNLTDRMKTALQCMRDGDTTATPTSAYRPPAYNQHLMDVWNKWDELKENMIPACQALRAEVQAHFNRHQLQESQGPALNSAHTRGEAVDMTSRLSSSNLNGLAGRCELTRPLPATDPVHFIHR